MSSDESAVHILVLRGFAILFVTFLLSFNIGIMKRNRCVFHRYRGFANGVGGIEAVSIQIDCNARAIALADIVSFENLLIPRNDVTSNSTGSIQIRTPKQQVL